MPMSRRSGLPVLLATLAVLAWPALADNTLRGPRPVVWKDFLGVNAQFQYFAPSVYQKQMDRLDALGLNWVRLSIHWAMIEPVENSLQLDSLMP